MRRRLFTVVAALSLLLCLAACALWMRSMFVADSIFWQKDLDPRPELAVSHSTWLSSSRGGLGFGRGENTTSGDPARVAELEGRARKAAAKTSFLTDGWQQRQARSYPVDRHVLGFDWEREADDRTFQFDDGTSIRLSSWQWSAAVPYAFFVVLTGWAPVLFAVRLRRFLIRRSRSRQGRCLRCGYDLRASPGHCPECGAAAACRP